MYQCGFVIGSFVLIGFRSPERQREGSRKPLRETQRQSRRLRGGTDRVGKETHVGRVVREVKWLKNIVSKIWNRVWWVAGASNSK